MKIRAYKASDEQQWLKCRLLSFYDCSYCDDVIHEKPVYDNQVIDLVAVEDEQIVGFIEVEIEKKCKDVCYLDGELGGNIWNIGVLPEYRRDRVATQLLDEAVRIAKGFGIARFEAWTQDDVAANRWYERSGFLFIESYLTVYASWRECEENKLITEHIGEIYGVRELNFEAPISRKDEVLEKYSKVHEVKLYELKF
ncbi:MAG TPA: GNAT family N-acetyltransferase [Thermotogota bacterium]|nr:GNAT family N-acetyltransferase [Thermotogota bacterium]